ncbi:MAG: response regulator transcription factor, partial [Eubacteriales bacterium]|nr:response regulator transcription factor [Eubacteriales bacterium]
MYKILVVDDEAKIRELIRKYAEFEGHTISEASDGLTAVQMCRQNPYDIVIMDIMMPELDGFSACREIRKFSSVPILMLSARGEEYDRINGFELGIDDYVVKPFSPKELMLRIEAIMKRVSAPNSTSTEPQFDIYNTDGLCVNFTARSVTVDGQPID